MSWVVRVSIFRNVKGGRIRIPRPRIIIFLFFLFFFTIKYPLILTLLCLFCTFNCIKLIFNLKNDKKNVFHHRRTTDTKQPTRRPERRRQKYININVCIWKLNGWIRFVRRYIYFVSFSFLLIKRFLYGCEKCVCWFGLKFSSGYNPNKTENNQQHHHDTIHDSVR